MTENNEISCKENTEIIQSDEMINNFKSFYYLLNATPDQQIKIFDKDKIITLEDIYSLNDKFQKKLNNHHTVINTTSISVMLSENTIQEYNNFEEFKRTDWIIPNYTKNIFIEWSFHIQLPNYKMPQPHKIKVRIGSDIKPNELFQIMVQEDNDAKIEEAIAQVICKIDFVNAIICNELFQIMQLWYDSLPTNSKNKKIQNLISKHSKNIARCCDTSINVIMLAMYYYVIKSAIRSVVTSGIELNKILEIGMGFFIGALIIKSISDFLGSAVGNFLFNKVNNIKESHNLLITKGDKNKILDTNKDNKKISTEIFISLTANIILLIFSLIFGFIKDSI